MVVLGWIGAVLMIIASFNMGTIGGCVLAVSGLILLTVQAISLKQYNLIILNLCSIIGFCFSIYGL